MKHLTPEPPRWLILSKALEETRSENRKLTGRLEKRDERIRALEAGLREIIEDHWRDSVPENAREIVRKLETLLAAAPDGKEGK